MARALELAAKGGRAVAPNPLVGAVIVRDGVIIGEGYHTKFGAPHAEIDALRSLSGNQLTGTETLYVTLEPCSHFGKTPPCTDALLQSGIRHVVVGCRDPFPMVAGTGIEKLRNNGIRVDEGLLDSQCRFLNRRFIVRHQKKRPFIILKWAQTQDGFIARDDGTSQWISGEESRALVHLWRSIEPAIFVGSRTAATDNPSLTVRLVAGQNPTRILLDRKGIVKADTKIFDNSAPTIRFCSKSEEAILEAPPTCATVFLNPTPGSPTRNQHEPLLEICTELYEQGILSVLVEGGSELIGHFLRLGLWDEARVFTSQLNFGSGVAAPQGLPSSKFKTSVGIDTLEWHINPTLLSDLNCTEPFLDPLTPLSPH